MSDWYVYQHDGDPLGPWSTDTVANEILTGRLAPDVWVAAPGGPKWLRALDVPVIHRLVDGVPTKPRRRDSGLRLMPGAFVTENGMPAFGSTMMIVKDEELEPSQLGTTAPPSGPASSAQTVRGAPPADETAKIYGFAPVEEGPPTDRVMPPSSSTPEPPTPVKKKERDTAEMPSSDRRRRRKNA